MQHRGLTLLSRLLITFVGANEIDTFALLFDDPDADQLPLDGKVKLNVSAYQVPLKHTPFFSLSL